MPAWFQLEWLGLGACRSGSERGSEAVHQQSRAASAFRHVIATVASKQQEHILLGVGEVRARTFRTQLDRDQGNGAAAAVKHQLSDIDNSSLVNDVQELRTDFNVFGRAADDHVAAHELLSADAEVQLVQRLRRFARHTKPASALRQIRKSGKDPLHWRVKVERQRKRAVLRTASAVVADSIAPWSLRSVCAMISAATH